MQFRNGQPTRLDQFELDTLRKASAILSQIGEAHVLAVGNCAESRNCFTLSGVVGDIADEIEGNNRIVAIPKSMAMPSYV